MLEFNEHTQLHVYIRQRVTSCRWSSCYYGLDPDQFYVKVFVLMGIFLSTTQSGIQRTRGWLSKLQSVLYKKFSCHVVGIN